VAAEDPLDACDAFIRFAKGRAKKNQIWAYLSVTMLSGTTALIPILILASTWYYPFVLSKPSR